jgi:hypothetical protein
MNIVPPLDDHRAYIFCPACHQNGVKSELRREQHMMLCPLNHAFEYRMIQQMMMSGNPPEMLKTEIIEQPSPHAEKFGVWMHPKTWQLLQERYKGRLLVTLGTVMDALADGSIIFTTGEDAIKLRAAGIKSSKDMVAMVESRKEIEQQILDQQKIIDKLAPILQAAGVGGII